MIFVACEVVKEKVVDHISHISFSMIPFNIFPPKTYLKFHLSHRLTSHLSLPAYESGSYSIGPWGLSSPSQPSSLSVGVTTTKRNGSGWTLQTTAGLAASRISADWSTKVPGGLKLKFGADVGIGSSPSLFINADGRLTDNVRGGILLQCEFGGGIIMKFKWVSFSLYTFPTTT